MSEQLRAAKMLSLLIVVIKSDRIGDGILPGTFYSWYTRQGHVCKVQAIMTLVFRCKLAGNGASLKIYLRRANVVEILFVSLSLFPSLFSREWASELKNTNEYRRCQWWQIQSMCDYDAEDEKQLWDCTTSVGRWCPQVSRAS